MTLAAAAYYITKENITVYYPDGFHLYQADGERSDGFEFSAVGKLSDRWSLLANYTYTDTLMSDPAAASPIGGQRALGVPYNAGNIWTRYDLIANECRTLGVGLGMVCVGDRLGDYFSPLVLPSYTRWDAGFFYRYKRLDVNLFVENLFGAVYYTSSINQFEVFPGADELQRAVDVAVLTGLPSPSGRGAGGEGSLAHQLVDFFYVLQISRNCLVLQGFLVRDPFRTCSGSS